MTDKPLAVASLCPLIYHASSVGFTKSIGHSLKELSELNTVRWDMHCISNSSM